MHATPLPPTSSTLHDYIKHIGPPPPLTWIRPCNSLYESGKTCCHFLTSRCFSRLFYAVDPQISSTLKYVPDLSK